MHEQCSLCAYDVRQNTGLFFKASGEPAAVAVYMGGNVTILRAGSIRRPQPPGVSLLNMRCGPLLIGTPFSAASGSVSELIADTLHWVVPCNCSCNMLGDFVTLVWHFNAGPPPPPPRARPNRLAVSQLLRRIELPVREFVLIVSLVGSLWRPQGPPAAALHVCCVPLMLKKSVCLSNSAVQYELGDGLL